MITPSRDISPGQVASHYDELDRFYRRLWGVHVHHGLWRYGNETPQQAVEQLIDTVVEPLALTRNSQVCDVGCGYGATSQYVANKFGASLTGITLSSAQHKFAQTQHNENNPNPRIVLGDWTENEFESSSFDSVISIECLAHIVDKPKFFQQIQRVLKPGGRCVVTAWLAGDQYRPWQRRRLLEPICREGRLPSMGKCAEYEALARQSGLEVIQFDDLSDQVRKTWRICSRKVFTHLVTRPDTWWHFIRHRSNSWVFLFSIYRIRLAYRTGAMRYGMFVLEKQKENEQEKTE